MTDSWQSLHETCQRLEHDVTSNLGSSRGASFHAQTQWRDQVQESLGRYTLSVLSLRQKLNTESANLTDGEKRRREAFVSALEGREKQLRLVFQQQQSGAKQKRSTDDQRKRLLDSAIIDVGTDDSWTNREDEPLLASGANSSDMLSSYQQRKEHVLAEQDKGLDALHEVIIRQKHLAGNIQTEASAHNDLLDDIDDGLDRTTQRLVTTTQSVRTVSQRDKVWKYWLIIFLLLVVMIIIIAMPSKH